MHRATATGQEPADLPGDPEKLADYQFHMALELCGTCEDYHALWPYRRLAGLVFDVEDCAATVEPLLRRHTRRDGRILIAGAADAGTFAQVTRATKELNAIVDVADRCATPLAVCRRYAETHGLQLSTLPLDFNRQQVRWRYDVIFIHCMLQFIAPATRLAFLRRLRGVLRIGGALMLVERVNAGKDSLQPQTDYGPAMLERLKERGIKIPESEASFLERTKRAGNERDRRMSTSFTPDELKACVTDSGFLLQEHSGPIRIDRVHGGSIAIEIVVSTVLD
jgi:hypothetical protein